MAGMIQVTPKTLRSKADELRSQNKTLRTQIDQFRSQANSLNGMWEGDAHNAFKAETTKSMGKMEQFCAAIDNFATALDNIANQYEAAESKNVSIAAVGK